MTPKATCPPHSWAIDPASGPTSRGTCHLCHEQRLFQNSIPDIGWATNRGRPRKQKEEDV